MTRLANGGRPTLFLPPPTTPSGDPPLERIAEQAISTGFRNVVLMGDHGGGQPNVYAEAARKLEEWRRLGAVGPHRDGGRRPDSRTGTAARP